MEVQEQTLRTISSDIHNNFGPLLSITKLTISTVDVYGEPAIAQEKVHNALELLMLVKMIGGALDVFPEKAKGTKAILELLDHTKTTCMNKMEISIAIVDDHTLFRDGLSNLLDEFDHISILFVAKNGLDMQDKLKLTGPPDVILMDINMPVMDGHDATIWLKEHFPIVHVLALSMYEDDINIIKMLRKGAGGYVLKECNADELVRAIQSIVDTGYYINDLVSGKLIRSVQQEQRNEVLTSRAPVFSPRELEFLLLCCSELTYKQIAGQMKISPRTVDGYREDFFEKLEIKSRVGLVLYAIKNRLITV